MIAAAPVKGPILESVSTYRRERERGCDTSLKAHLRWRCSLAKNNTHTQLVLFATKMVFQKVRQVQELGELNMLKPRLFKQPSIYLACSHEKAPNPRSGKMGKKESTRPKTPFSFHVCFMNKRYWTLLCGYCSFFILMTRLTSPFEGP